MSLEMRPRLRYKICICSVILGELESFGNYKGFQYYLPENVRGNLRYYEVFLSKNMQLELAEILLSFLRDTLMITKCYSKQYKGR